MKGFRNWIEEQTGKRIEWNPVYVGSRGGRTVYEIQFEDGTTKDYFIDYEDELVEPV